MNECAQPLYIEVAAGILITVAIVSVMWGIMALFYYAGYGLSASRKAKREEDKR